MQRMTVIDYMNITKLFQIGGFIKIRITYLRHESQTCCWN